MTRSALARQLPAIALVFLASAWTPPMASAQERTRRTVLAIHWGPEDYPTAAVVNASIQRALRSDANIQIDYFVEYLESDAFAADAVSLALADYIRQKYRGRRIDVVIAIADPALRFVLDHRDELFPDVPIVYSGVAVLADSRGGAPRGLTAKTATPEYTIGTSGNSSSR